MEWINEFIDGLEKQEVEAMLLDDLIEQLNENDVEHEIPEVEGFNL